MTLNDFTDMFSSAYHGTEHIISGYHCSGNDFVVKVSCGRNYRILVATKMRDGYQKFDIYGSDRKYVEFSEKSWFFRTQMEAYVFGSRFNDEPQIQIDILRALEISRGAHAVQFRDIPYS